MSEEKERLRWRIEKDGVEYTLTKGVGVLAIEDPAVRNAAMGVVKALERFYVAIGMSPRPWLDSS